MTSSTTSKISKEQIDNLMEYEENKTLEDIFSEIPAFREMENLLSQIWRRQLRGMWLEILSLLLLCMGILGLFVDVYKSFSSPFSSWLFIFLGLSIQITMLLENTYVKRDFYPEYLRLNKEIFENVCFYLYHNPEEECYWNKLNKERKDLSKEISVIKKDYPQIYKLMSGKIYFR